VPKFPEFHSSFIHCHVVIADEANKSYAIGLTSLSDEVRTINLNNKEISIEFSDSVLEKLRVEASLFFKK
jgi:hypothetical protein